MLYDVFISYASEDRVKLVRPLAARLRRDGYSVWYDEFELRLGDSVSTKSITVCAIRRPGSLY